MLTFDEDALLIELKGDKPHFHYVVSIVDE